MDFENCLHIKEEDFKSWAFEKVKSYESIPNLEYWHESGEIVSKYIPTDQIVGTNHLKYAGGTWAEALVNLKHYSYEEPELLIERICIAEPSPTLGKFNNEYYIFDGNNRLCKARFLNLSTFYCRVKEYVFNYYDFNMSTLLMRLGFEFKYEPTSEYKFSNITYGKQPFFLSDEVSIGDFVNLISTFKYSIMDHIIYTFCSRNANNTSWSPFTVGKGKRETRRLKKKLYYLGFRGGCY